MVAQKYPPAIPDAIADAIDRLAIAIAERGAKLEDYTCQIEGLLEGNFDSWRQAYIKLGLPTFSGAPDEWLRFYRSYKETAAYFSVDENRSRVYSNLRGPARDYARRLVHARYPADYILNSLGNHFNLFIAVASKLIKNIDQLQTLHEDSWPNEFVMFATQVDNIVSALSSLSQTYYLDDPRLAMKVINRVNEHHRECWRAYSAHADLPILIKVSKFLNEQAAKVCSFSHAWVRPTVDRPKAFFDAEALWTEARKQLERLPRLETPAPAQQVVLFAAILKNVVYMVSAKDKWLLADGQVFFKVLDRLNPFYTWRWYDYAAKHRAAPQPELATLAWFMTDEAARVSASAPAAKYQHELSKESKRPSVPKPGGCLCCHGDHWTAKCRALRRMSDADRLRWARKVDVCLQCLGKHRGRRCRAPRCSVPHCHRAHHVMLHTNHSILK